jgi:tRNA pseudouridine55 synthase
VLHPVRDKSNPNAILEGRLLWRPFGLLEPNSVPANRNLLLKFRVPTETIAIQKSKMLSMEGTLIIDKPAGMSSHDVVVRVRKIIGERRVGHTGTLDPFATGVLVVLAGKATRLMQFLSGAEKEYEAVIRLGYATDSGDVTGTPLPRTSSTEKQTCAEIQREEVENAMSSLRGEIDQIPPMYSAKKVKGRKLYELARRGEEIERAAVPVTISAFEALERDGKLLRESEDGTRDLSVRVACSAGTYVRTLAEDFGKRLGLGAHLAELRRTRAGSFKITEANTLEQLSDLAESGLLSQAFISPDATLAHLPALDLSADDIRRVLNGLNLQVEPAAWPTGQAVRLRDAGGGLTAVGIYDEAKKFVHPEVVIGS